jgi:copper chaperone NosL
VIATLANSRPRTFLLRAALYCAAALALAGCGKTDDFGPPDIHFGQDTCHACGMIIEDDRYAAAAVFVTPTGDVERQSFDDAGEMLEFQPPAGTTNLHRYVRDASTRHWLDATTATFVKAPDLQTPMGSGIAAYSDPATARAFADTHKGTLLPRPPSPITGDK